MKRVAFISFFIIFSALFWPIHAQANLSFFVEQDEVQLEHPLVMINGNFMIPLWVFEQYLESEVSYLVEEQEITMVFPDQTILMRLGAESAQVDGQDCRLDVAPQLVEGEVVVPLRFVADQRGLSLVFIQEPMALRLERRPKGASRLASITAGLVVETPEPQPAPEEIVLHQPDAEAQDLREIVFMGGARSRVFIDLLSYTGYQTNLLTNPDRLVLDLTGVGGDPLPALEVDDLLVTGIRSSRFDEQTMRIVCDLNNSTGYSITPWPEGGLEIEFNYRIGGFRLEARDDFAQLCFESSALPILDAVYLEDPLRLVLDFQGTTLLDPAFDLTVEQERIFRIRGSQHLPAITRIVLDLEQPIAPLEVYELGEGRFALPLFAGTAREAQSYLATLLAEPRDDPPGVEPTATGVLSGLVIVVDPGHGGSDPGTVGFQGTFEKDVVLAISLFLGEYLAEAGAKVVYTRDKDQYVSIFERPQIAIDCGAHMFVSVHVNANLQRGKARGTETLYRAEDEVSKLLARTVQDELVQAITLADRRVWGRDDLAVFNGSSIPSILVEVGFLDHPDEEVLLRASGFQQVAAQGIYNGIERFYLENKN